MTSMGSHRWLIANVLFLAMVGCQATSRHPQDLESPLPKLTSAVLAEVRYPDTSVPVSDDQLLQQAIQNQPALQKAFQDVLVKVWHDDRNVIILVCSPDGRYCWFEDASWTIGVDRRCYQNKPPVPPEFTLVPSPKNRNLTHTRPASQRAPTTTALGS